MSISYTINKFYGLLLVFWDVISQALKRVKKILQQPLQAMLNGAGTQVVQLRKVPDISKIGDDVSGLTAIVTGSTSGIGLETAKALAMKGANVILACRNEAKGADCANAIQQQLAQSGAIGTVAVMKVDLSNLQSVRNFAQLWSDNGKAIHMLVNNAGIFDMSGARRETVDGFEQHMGTNHLGHFLLTLLLLPFVQLGAQELVDMQKNQKQTLPNARIVNVASLFNTVGRINKEDMMCKNRYKAAEAYSSSKLAQMLFTLELRKRLLQRRIGQIVEQGAIEVVSLHPGMVLTDVSRELPLFVQKAQKALISWMLLTPAEGARCSVHCATYYQLKQQIEDHNKVQQKVKDARRSIECGYFHSDCTPQQPLPLASDASVATWLFDWSVKQTNVPSQFIV